MLNASNFDRAQRVEAGRIQAIFGKTVGNRKMRRTAMAQKRQKVSSRGVVDRINEAMNNIPHGMLTFFGTQTLHPTRGYRFMTGDRVKAQATMLQKYGFVR